MSAKKGTVATPKTPTTSSSDYAIPLLYRIIPPCILASLTAVFYFPSLHYEFQFDDVANITKHFSIRHNTFSELFFQNSRWISYWLNSVYYKIGKFDPFSYRVGNVVLHTTNSILIFFVLLYALTRLKKESFFKHNSFVLAFTTALLFALHPVQTQTVSYVIQGQLEGLAAFFTLSMMLTLLFLVYAQSTAAKIVLGAFLFALAAFSCGSKEIAIISPLLLMLFDWFLLAQGEWHSIKSRLPVYALLSIVVVGWYLHFLKPTFFTEIISLSKTATNNIGNVITADPKAKILPWDFFISQFKVILHYLWIFIWPLGISVEYDWKIAASFFAFDCLVPLLALLAIAGVIAYLLKKDRAHVAAFCLLWFFFCILPRSSIIPSPELLVDYKTYMASFGWLTLLACAFIALISFLYNKVNVLKKALAKPLYGHTACALLLAIPLGLQTMQRNTVWRSGLDFWGNILQNAPGKARAYNNYGVELSQNFKKFKESVPYFLKAIEMDSNYPDPCNNVAVAYSMLGETDLAIEALKKGLTINPYYPEGYNNLASFFLKKQDFAQAERVLLTAIKLRPHYGKAYFNLGRVYLEQDKKEEACECFRKCCMEADLDNEFGFSTYARAALALQKYDEAIAAFKKTLEFAPTDQETLFNLGNAYFFAKKYDDAIKAYENLMRIHPNDLRGQFNLGETYFVMNNAEKALAVFESIKASHAQLPQLYVRIAGCYEKQGNPLKAQQVLVELSKSNIPPELKQQTKMFLTQLEQQYKLKAISG